MANLYRAKQTNHKMDFVANGMAKYESNSCWPEQLFKQSGGLLKDLQGKTYFTHRYHVDPGDTEQTQFGALFSGLGEGKANSESISADSSPLIGHISELLNGKSGLLGTTQSFVTNPTSFLGNELRTSASQAFDSPFTVLNCYNETPDTKTFRLGRQDGKDFDYLPGQYISLTIVISGREYKRSYSLGSSPTRRGTLEITVKRASKEAVVSNWLNDHLKPGDKVSLKGPFGKFTCAKNTPQKILFLAAGSGMVPIMSMLRWLADTEARVDVILLLSFRTPDDIIYGDELKLIAAHHKNIKLSITLTKELCNDASWTGLTGRVNEKMIAGLVPDMPERTVYLCGPDAFMDTCKQNLLHFQLPAEQLYCETFTASVSPAKIKNSPSGLPSANKTGNYQIQFIKSGITVDADGAMTLLALAETSGVHISHECRAGSCGECMVKCLNGKIDMTEQAEIDNTDRKKGWVYACCAYPVSNAVLDI
jgi:glycine betaine catabolism B